MTKQINLLRINLNNMKAMNLTTRDILKEKEVKIIKKLCLVLVIY